MKGSFLLVRIQKTKKIHSVEVLLKLKDNIMKIRRFFREGIWALKNFPQKTKRAWQLVKFSYKTNPWNEEDTFLEFLIFYLTLMQDQFKKDELMGYYNEVEKIELVKKLLTKYLKEEYTEEYMKDNSLYDNILSAHKKEERAKNIAFDLIKQHIGTWWI